MIRLATSKDVDAITTLEVELFDNSMSSSMVQRELEHGTGLVLGDPIQAYALLRFERNLIDVTRLGVTAEAQGKGLGRKLLERVVSTDKTVILTVRKSNQRAFRLYTSMGFQIVAHFIAEASWLLERQPSQEKSSVQHPTP